ncbi:uncharacterized protein LOC121856822 [Homarus americanus]|uniref:Transcriptional repressor CTCF-like 3 n=1 Tax=Homarus americanus TaxID=6706 RepID=A0A8J5J8I7_HOMAM|nr:uncharacterized protein LOC121856822 [Homarus americanus]XP_042208484.1 uncharacterized protein LOC121856822 [Homarus americanus]KAG7154020.1 Transcriptional repressor CTCF-like 3 [Homarus americanus]
MQDERETDRRPKTASRVYPPRPKRQRSCAASLVTQQGCVSEGDGSYARAPTPYNINLPPCNLGINITNVSQAFIGDCSSSPLQPSIQCTDVDTPVFFTSKDSKYFDHLDTKLRNAAAQTLHKTTRASTQNPKVISGAGDGVKSHVPQDVQGCKRTSILKSPKSPKSPNLSNSGRDGSISNDTRKSNCQEGNVTSCVQQNKVKFPKQVEDNFRAGELKRPQHQVVGFLEDHAEFGSDWLETMEWRGKYAPSVLESTVDGSIVKGAKRSYRSRLCPNDVDFFINTTIENGSDQDPLISLDELGLKTEQHKYKCSLCEMVSRSRSDVELHIASWDDHSEAVVVVLLGNQARGRSCPICNIRLQRTHLFKHIRNAHRSFFPLHCGYCVFLGQDYNQLRHHIRNKHGTSNYNIIDIPRLLAENDQPGLAMIPMIDDEGGSGEDYDEDDKLQTGSMICPVCGRGLKTLANLKKHISHHSREKQRCVLCPFTTSLPAQIKSHYQRRHPTEIPQSQTVLLEKNGSNALVEDVKPYLTLVTAKYGVRQPKKQGKWKRQYRCPHCDYTCNYNSSYNRHLRLHKGDKPFKCGYCDFHAREVYVVRNHCSKVHKGKEAVIENDKDFKAPYRYSSRKNKKCEWMSGNDEGEEELGSLTTSTCSLSLQSRVKLDKKFTLSQVEDFSSRTSNDSRFNKKIKENESSVGINVPPALTGTENSVGIKAREKLSLCEDQDKKQRRNEMSGKPSPRSSPKKNLKPIGELQMTCPPHNITVTAGGSSYQIRNVPTANRNENVFMSNLEEIPETHIPPRVSDEVMKGKTGETINFGSSLNTFCYEEQSDQQLHRGEAQIFKQTPLFQGNLPVKLKTFKLSQETQLGIMKTKTVLRDNKIQTCDKEVRLQPESNILTSYHCKSEDTRCSVNLSVSEISDISEKTVIIDLFATDGDNLRLEKITHCSVSNEVEESAQKYSDSNKQNSSHSMTTSCMSAGLLKSGSDAVKAAKCSKIKNISEKSSKVDECGNQTNHHQTASLVTVPTEGLENNLYTHIAFLTDSRVQRLSNHISATPGVMTRDLLGLDYSNNDYFCSEKVRLMMKEKKGGRVKCRECGTTTTYRAFYKHAKKHFNIKPFQCGYCSYRSIEKSKIRVHNTFCHPSSPCMILKLSPENAAVNLSNKNDSTVPETEGEKDNSFQSLGSESIGLSTASNSQTSITNTSTFSSNSTMEKLSSSIKKPKTPIYNPTTSASSSSEVMVSSLQRQSPFQCPICLKILQKHTSTIRRHLYSHYGYKPYKCGYCNFTGIGQSEVRAHHVTHGFTTVPKVEPSGIPIPPGLTPYISDLLSHHRVGRPPHKKKGQQCQQNSALHLKEASSGGHDLVWTDSEAVSKEDLTTLYLTQQEIVSCSQQGGLESLSVETCPMPQSLQSEDLTSEAAYAVQVLESGQDSSSPGTLPSQLDLSVVADSHSDLNSDSVCVVYLVE